jgi:prophage antirepressor-like protein
MTNIQVFENPEFGEIRTIIADDTFSVVAKDVAERLDYTWHRGLLDHVPDEWKGVSRIDPPGGAQELKVLTEQGLYFFLARSDKPLAIPFQKWIAGTVLPSIRKTGSYSKPGTLASADGMTFVEWVLPHIPPERGFTITRSKTGVITVRVKEPSVPKVPALPPPNPVFPPNPSRVSQPCGLYVGVGTSDPNGKYRDMIHNMERFLGRWYGNRWITPRTLFDRLSARHSLLHGNFKLHDIQWYRMLNVLIVRGTIERVGRRIRLVAQTQEGRAAQ